jgi:hypothetical protein
VEKAQKNGCFMQYFKESIVSFSFRKIVMAMLHTQRDTPYGVYYKRWNKPFVAFVSAETANIWTGNDFVEGPSPSAGRCGEPSVSVT